MISAGSSGGRSKTAPSAPMAIPVKAATKPRPGGMHAVGGYSMPAPNAPLIGSLKAPTQLERVIPDLLLPESYTEAFSMAVAHTEQANTRLVGVSSAPARTWMENAAQKHGIPFNPASVIVAGAPLGTSPTVLSFMESKRGTPADDSLLLASRRKEAAALGVAGGAAVPAGGVLGGLTSLSLKATLQQGGAQIPSGLPPPHPAALPQEAGGGGLSQMFRRGGAGSYGGSGGSGGAPVPVVLSASFRDPSTITFAAANTIDEEEGEEGEGGDNSSDDEAREAPAMVTVGAGRTLRPVDDGSDDDDDGALVSGKGKGGGKPAGVGAAPAPSAAADGDDGIFEGDFE